MTTTRILTSILVGSHFHPGAKAMLEHLPNGAELKLEHERDNPYDENAIIVSVKPSEVPDSEREELAVKLPGYGLDLNDLIIADEPFALGHVASSEGKPLGKALLVRADLCGNVQFLQVGLDGKATLGFDGAGLTLVNLEYEE